MGWKDWFSQLRRGKIDIESAKPIPFSKTVPLSEKDAFANPSMTKFSGFTTNVPDLIGESNLKSMSPEQRMRLAMQKRQTLRSFSKEEPTLGQNLVTLWTDAISDRRTFLSAQEELSMFYIVDQIMEALVEDSLSQNDRGEIIEFSSEIIEVKEELDNFKKIHNLDNFIGEIAEDLIYMGEMFVRIEATEGEGVTAISEDQVNQLGILALYESGVPSNYMVFMGHDYQIMPATTYAHFVLGSRKMRIALDNALNPDYQVDMDKIDPELKKKLPDYVRVGKPMFFRMVSKLRELQLLENLLIALKLNQITQSKVVAVRVPPSMPAEQVADVIADINEILNSQTGIDLVNGQITIAEIMTQAGRFQAVPNYLDDKGAILPLNIREDVNVDDLLATIDNMRQVILSSIGIPYSLIYGGEQGDSRDSHRASEIRRFGRYARKLKKIQWSIAKGIKQIAMVHLRNKGIECTFDSFDVVFTNSMVDVSGLEKMEFDDAKQEMVARKLDFVAKMEATPGLAQEIYWPGVFEWLDYAFMDLTDGIPLFKFSRKIKRDEEIDEPEFDNIRDQFMSVATDSFLANRELRQSGEDDIEGANLVAGQTDAFIDKVKTAFQARREKRKQITADTSPEQVVDILKHAQDRFKMKRAAREK